MGMLVPSKHLTNDTVRYLGVSTSMFSGDEENYLRTQFIQPVSKFVLVGKGPGMKMAAMYF
jgi:hypothetical protein